jgi:hypothetical protein
MNTLIQVSWKKLERKKEILGNLFIQLAKVQSTAVEFSEDTELVKITFGESLKIGTGKLHISYKGTLNENLKGFYRSKYKHPSGEIRYAATTQFEVCLFCCFFFSK